MTPLRSVLAAALTVAALIIMSNGAHAQGLIGLDNIYNTGSSTATTNGLFYVKTNGSSAVLIQQDFNAAFYGGSNSSSLTLLATFLTSDGSATGDNAAGPGTFLDPSGVARAITNAVSWGYVQVQAWLGSYSSYAAAVAANGYAAQSAVFSNSVASPPSTPPDLTLMPSIVLTAGGNGNSPLGGGGGGSSVGPSPSSGGGGGSPLGPTGFDPSSSVCGLWLSVATSNTTATVTLHNTRQSETYQLWSAQVVSTTFTNWSFEASVTGASGDTTKTNIAMGSRSNLFFRATENRIYTNATTFPGLGFADTRAINPDTMGAVGPYFCELLNGKTNPPTLSAFAVYSKSSGTNGPLVQTNINGFFAVHDPVDGTNYPTGSMTDTRILYDPQSQCWIATAIDTGSWQVMLAVCTNAINATNLTTGWNRYVLRVLQTQNGYVSSDFDTPGLDGNGIYLSVLQRGPTNYTHTFVAIKKPDIYLGTNTATYITTSNFDSTLLTVQPVVNFDAVPSDGYAWLVAKGPPNLTNYQGGAVFYRRLQWSGTNAAWADTNWLTVSTSTNYQDYYDLDSTNGVSGISAPQAPNTTNSAIVLYDVGSRLAASTIRNGFLWTCHAVGLSSNGTYTNDASGTGVTRSGAQWLKMQISPDNSSLSLADHGRLYDTNSTTDNPWWYGFPSLMVNCAGDMVLGLSGSTATNYLSAFYTWRISSGAMPAQPGLIQGGTSQSPSRTGDYSATTLDPTDDWTFWTVQQYGTNLSTSVAWGTAIAKIRPNP